MEIFDQVPKKWYAIRPSLIGSDYNRYEIFKQNSRNIFAFLKTPCIGMEGCDRCSGPHRARNKKCSKNLNKAPFIKGPGNFKGGIYLFFLDTQQQKDGIWEIVSLNKKSHQRSGIIHLRKI
jgi:hypothetical protein